MGNGHRLSKDIVVRLSMIGISLVASVPPAQAASQDAIGLFTSVQGKVFVTHRNVPAPKNVRLRDDVFFKDVIETLPAARTKAIFQDDSLLTVGENSRVEIAEHIYNPEQGSRSMIVNLVKGKVRSLVGQVFAGLGSRFEVHTPTAVAAARGTYFVVWIEEEKPAQVGDAGSQVGQARPVALADMDVAQFGLPPGATGVANIGQTGSVNFTSGGQTTILNPGQYTIAFPGAPPLPPTNLPPPNQPSSAPGSAAAHNAIKGTEVKDSPKPETPKDTLVATGGTLGGGTAGGGGPAGGGPPGGTPAGGQTGGGQTGKGGGDSGQQSGQQTGGQQAGTSGTGAGGTGTGGTTPGGTLLTGGITGGSTTGTGINTTTGITSGTVYYQQGAGGQGTTTLPSNVAPSTKTPVTLNIRIP
jgi:hypothetical protein